MRNATERSNWTVIAKAHVITADPISTHQQHLVIGFGSLIPAACQGRRLHKRTERMIQCVVSFL